MTISHDHLQPTDADVWDISTADLSRRFGVTAETARRWMTDGQLEFYQSHPGGRLRTCERAVQNMIDRGFKARTG